MNARSQRIGSTLGFALALLALTACEPVTPGTASEARIPRATETALEVSISSPTVTPMSRASATPDATATGSVRMNPLDPHDLTATPAALAQSDGSSGANSVSATVTSNHQGSENLIVVKQGSSSSATAETADASGSANARSEGSTSTSQSQVNVNITSSSSASGGQTQTQTTTRSAVNQGTSSAAAATPPPFPTMQAAENPSVGQNENQKIYQLCGQDDSGLARAIEQFIAGRGFSAQLISRSGACPNLTITIPAGSASGSSRGTQKTHLSVTSGGRDYQIDIVSENGITRASVGSGA